MSEKISRIIFLGESIIIIVPSSLLLLVATILQTTHTIKFFNLYDLANTLFALIACVAVVSGIGIGSTFVIQGISGIRNLKPILWILALLGATLSLAATTSMILPPFPEYSRAEMFRNDFEYFALGLPVFFPLVHLILERFSRKERETA